MPARRLACSRVGRGVVCALGLATSAMTRLNAEPKGNSAWQDLREWRFTEAARSFEESADEPTHRLGLAVAWLNLQPRTADRIARAEQELSALAKDASASADVVVTANYLLARIAEVHAFTPDPARAADRYAALLASHPHHPFAQMAAARLATLRLYKLGADPLRTLADLEALGPQLTDAGARRDFHLVLGRSHLFFGGNRSRALDHLQSAMAAGIAAATVRADVLVQIGEVARELDQPAVSRQAWSEFVATFPRDPRVDLIRERLLALPEEARP